MRSAVNLTKLAAELHGNRRLISFKDAIERFHSAFSINADLEDARDALAHLRAVHTSPTQRSKFGAALMAHAVILYARAAISDQNGRKRVDVTKGYSDELKLKHASIQDLRNQVLAHYGIPTDRHGVRWNDEALVMKNIDRKISITFSVSRSNYLASAVDDLTVLVDQAIVVVSAAIDERGEVFADKLVEFRQDPEVAAIVARCGFDPSKFFGSAESVDSFWNSEDHRREFFEPRGG